MFRGGFQRCPNDGARLDPGDQDPLIGTVLAERYQIDDLIGEGGIGRVYRARHTRMSRRFAIKVPFGELGYDRKQRARFANEAEAASRLSHPNVIGIVDVGETQDGLFYMAMDLAEGKSLGDVVAGGPVPTPRALAILIQFADGLAHAHERGLVHRDLKPENVVLVDDGVGGEQVRIVDFGLAIVDASDGPRQHRLTTDGVVLGTPHYMAPEQATDEPLDFRTDLFAVGLILFEMLAGQHPFDGTPLEVARQNLSRELPPILTRSGVLVDPLLEALVTWLTQKKPGKRPQATALVARVARALAAGDRQLAHELLPAHLRPTLEPSPSPPAGSPATTPGSSTRVAPTTPSPSPSPSPPPSTTPAPVDPVRPSPSPTERAPASRRRLALVALTVLALVTVLAIMILSGSRGSGERVAILADAASAEVDATTSVATDVVDAEVMLDVPVDAGVTMDAGKRPPPVDARAAIVRPPPLDAGVVRPRPLDAGVVPPRPLDAGVIAVPVTNATLRQLYEQVGRALDQAIASRGRDATEPYRKRYSQIPPYLEAVRKDDLRKQAEAQLRALARDLEKLK